MARLDSTTIDLDTLHLQSLFLDVVHLTLVHYAHAQHTPSLSHSLAHYYTHTPTHARRSQHTPPHPMAGKLNMAAFGGAHTAGIFSDMTVDGPVIGTLVAIIDRARNLPNKRTMGKQDPYCAARLGKEAKKTTTDKRGGQTPKW